MRIARTGRDAKVWAFLTWLMFIRLDTLAAHLKIKMYKINNKINNVLLLNL